MNHLTVRPSFETPRELYLGSVVPVEDITRPHLTIVNVYGSKGPWDPGWYILGAPAPPDRPLAGPYDSEEAARRDLIATKNAFFAHYQHRDGYFGFFSGSAALYEPSVVLRPHMLALGRHTRVDAFCKLECGDGVFLGDYVHVASFCHLNIGGGTLIMEEGSSAGSGCRILSGSATLGRESCSATHPSVVNMKTTTRIRKGATLFVNVTVLQGCDIGEGAIIGADSFLPAGTVVPAGETWFGSPARKR